MKKFKWILLIFFLLMDIVCMNAQDFCFTPSYYPDVLQGSSQYQIVNNSYTVRIFFHIIRRTNGTGGQTTAEINTALNVLNSDYAPQGISFSLLGIDEILNDNIYNTSTASSFGWLNNNGRFITDADGDGKFDLFHPNSHTDAIDIYLFANDKLDGGLSAGIPGTALVIGWNYNGIALPSSHVLSHEVGHCLGLYHTFHGTNICESDGCPELVNGSNSTTCGDFVADTPADPQKIFCRCYYMCMDH